MLNFNKKDAEGDLKKNPNDNFVGSETTISQRNEPLMRFLLDKNDVRWLLCLVTKNVRSYSVSY